MKNVSRMLLLATAVVVIWAAPALAFHDDGVAHCNGCHTMHNSQDGDPMNFNASGTGFGLPVGQGFNDLLLFANKTDVCLNCHAGSGSYHIWATDPLAPGPEKGSGDFVFLQEDNINDAHGGASNPVLGHAAGHSVVSAMMSTGADAELTTSPGGSYPAADMACTSCHDPHGTDSFRLTYKTGQTTTSDTSHVINSHATIDADAISVFGPPESNGNHNAYKDGYSEWCSNCHQLMHTGLGGTGGPNTHPTGELLDGDQVAVYNLYNGTEDCINNPPAGGNPCGSGTFATAYLALVPLEDAGNTTSKITGATDGTSKVACVSCHRSHATSAPDAGRWDFNITGLDEDGHESSSYGLPNPYNEYQRSLCNKCHSRDEFDALVDFTP